MFFCKKKLLRCRCYLFLVEQTLQDISGLALIPERGSSASPSKEAAQAIMGVIIEYVRFPGPAYRTIPKSPLPLYQLVPEAKANLPLITSSDGNPPHAMR